MFEKFCVAMFAIVWAGSAPVPNTLRIYLLAEFVTQPFIYLTAHLYTSNSVEFLIVFAVATWLLFLAGVVAVWTYLKRTHYRLAIMPFALDIALIMAFVAYLGLPQPLWPDDWVNLSAGLLRTLLWVCLALSLTNTHAIEKRFLVPLCAWWCMRSLWDFGYPMHMPKWSHLNWLAPWAVGVTMFGLIGLLARLSYRRQRPSLG